MAIKFLNNSEVTGTLSVSSISNDNATYTGVVVWDGSVLKYRTKAQVKSDIGAGSGSVTSIATASPIQGGTITGSGTISITTATASAIGAGNVNINGGGNKDGLTLSYSGGTATLGVDIQSLPYYSGNSSAADTSSIYLMINNEDDVNNINQYIEVMELSDMINTNNYVTSASFGTGNGILTLNRAGLSAVTVDLDGRYVTSSGVTSVATTNGITGGTITSSGTLQVDSTVVRTSGAQTIAGEKTFTNQLAIDTAGGSERMRLYNENNTSPIADSFSGNTSKSYIYFDTVSGSNDPGYIMHESSATETNEGVLHLVPTDDNSDGDYVSIHGTNDADVLKLHTSGLVETVNLQLQLKSGNSVIYLNDGVTIQDDLTVSGGDITLGGTGRIQGVDTVSSNTDAANKLYVDNAVSGLGSGTVTSVQTGNGLTGGTITTTGVLSVDYSTGFDNLIFSANAWGSSIATTPYTPYILMADSNPGIAYDQVEKIRIEDIPMNRFGKPDSSIDMDTNKIINLETPTNSNDAANKQYVDDNAGGTPGNGQIDGRTSGLGLSGSMDATANQTGNTTFTVTSNATTAATASTIAYRDSNADLNVRLLRANYTNQSTISGAIAFRVNNSTDNYTRYCSSPSAIRAFIGAGTSSTTGTVTAIGTGNGISGGTITSSGTLTVGAGNGLSQSSTGLLMSGSYSGNFALSNGNFTVADTTNGGTGLGFTGDALTIGNSSNSGSNGKIYLDEEDNGSRATISNGNNKFSLYRSNYSYSLQHNGTQWQFGSSSSTPALFIDPSGSGQVGFRTTNPGSAFDVNGTFRARNELNVGATSEQNFFVEGGSGPRYVKMGAYTPTNKDTWLSGASSAGLCRATAGFGTGGKVVMATYRYTTKIIPGGWPTQSGPINGVNVTPTPDPTELLIIKGIFVHKSGATIGNGWANTSFPARFYHQGNSGVYYIVGGVDRDTIVQGNGGWFYNAHGYIGSTTPPGQQGGVGQPVKLSLVQPLGVEPVWYITVEYSIINLDIYKTNVDRTLPG